LQPSSIDFLVAEVNGRRGNSRGSHETSQDLFASRKLH